MSDPQAVIVPEETTLTAPYWRGAREGELRLQRCSDCAVVVHPPQPTCPSCHLSASMVWFAASGRGVIHSVTIVEHATHPAVNSSLPYAVLLVRLDEGPLLISAPPSKAPLPYHHVGSPVRVVFEAVDGDDAVLPRFAIVAADQRA